jgi:hypothetical protein
MSFSPASAVLNLPQLSTRVRAEEALERVREQELNRREIKELIKIPELPNLRIINRKLVAGKGLETLPMLLEELQNIRASQLYKNEEVVKIVEIS